MKYSIAIAILTMCLVAGTTVLAQDEKEKKKMSVSLGTDGFAVKSETKQEENKVEKKFSVEIGIVDVGLNSIQDKSNYSSTAAQALLNVPDAYQNENLFNLRSGKSWNVNVWPVITSWRLVDGEGQKIYFATGVGLQMYNFRFNRPVTYINEVVPTVYLDTVHTITKNKLGFTYLSVPLMLTFKTKAAPKSWFVYGVGITGGYRLASWTKQVSKEQGKQKNHDKFNFSDFNSCLTAEFGLDGYFRLYASYQVTPLAENALEQYPFSIGIRFGGV